VAAYIIFIKEHEHDAKALAAYSEKARESLAGRPAKLLVYHGELETLEGPEAQEVVMIEFPSMEEARAWYRSEAYQKARNERFLAADFRVIMVQGH
jgi:uncharacterized protein (DUF1330 family)